MPEPSPTAPTASPEAFAELAKNPLAFLEAIKPEEIDALIQQLEKERALLDQRIRGLKSIRRSVWMRLNPRLPKLKKGKGANGAPVDSGSDPEDELLDDEDDADDILDEDDLEDEDEEDDAPTAPAMQPVAVAKSRPIIAAVSVARAKSNPTKDDVARLSLYDFLREQGTASLKVIGNRFNLPAGEVLRLLNCDWFEESGTGSYSADAGA